LVIWIGFRKGDLAGVYGYDIKHNGINYEIAYSIQEDDEGNIALVILAGTREQYYKELKVL
jgi:mRNA interferase RelE/StbE